MSDAITLMKEALEQEVYKRELLKLTIDQARTLMKQFGHPTMILDTAISMYEKTTGDVIEFVDKILG